MDWNSSRYPFSAGRLFVCHCIEYIPIRGPSQIDLAEPLFQFFCLNPLPHSRHAMFVIATLRSLRSPVYPFLPYYFDSNQHKRLRRKETRCFSLFIELLDESFEAYDGYLLAPGGGGWWECFFKDTFLALTLKECWGSLCQLGVLRRSVLLVLGCRGPVPTWALLSVFVFVLFIFLCSSWPG